MFIFARGSNGIQCLNRNSCPSRFYRKVLCSLVASTSAIIMAQILYSLGLTVGIGVFAGQFTPTYADLWVHLVHAFLGSLLPPPSCELLNRCFFSHAYFYFLCFCSFHVYERVWLLTTRQVCQQGGDNQDHY
jgi:hypothetical protein